MKPHHPMTALKGCTLEDVVVPGRPDIHTIEWKRATRWTWDDGGRDYPSTWESEDQDPEGAYVLTGDANVRIDLKDLPTADRAAILALIEAYQTANEPDESEAEPDEPPEVDPYERELERKERERNRE